MSKAVKTKRVHAASKRRPVEEVFDIEAGGSKSDGPQAPSLLDAVKELHRFHRRRQYIKQLSERYGCSAMTVDRAIAACEREWAEEAGSDRPKRVARTYATYLRLAKKAEDKGDDRAAAYIMKQADELLGDRAPKRISIEGLDDERDPLELQAEADRLRRLADEAGKGK